MTHARPNSFALPAPCHGARRLLAAALLIASGIAEAADFSVGLAAGTDQGRVDCVASFPCDRGSTYWKLFGDYRITEAIEVQALYFDAGHFQGGDTTPLGTEFGGSFKVGAFGLTAGYRWDIAPGWSAVARAGAAGVRTRFVYENSAFGSASKTTLQPLVGAGISYAISPAMRVGLDYDVTRFKVHTRQGSLQMLGFAAQYSF